MIRMLINFAIGTTGEVRKFNKNYEAYICSSFNLKSTFEEIDFCG